MKKIKVAQVITRMDQGGSPDIVRILTQYLDKSRFEVSFICGPSICPTDKTQNFLNSIKANLIQVDSLRREVHPVLDLIAFLKLWFIFKKQGFDIVHTHTAKAGALGRMAAFLAGIKIIIHTSHGHNFYGYFNPLISKIIVWIERFLGGLTSEIITLTEIEKADLIKFKICPASKIKAINTVLEKNQKNIDLEFNSLEIRQDLLIEKQEVVIGMVGRLEPIKGIEYFIQAALGLAQKFPMVHFLIVGEGSLRAGCEEKIRLRQFTQRFSFVGWQDKVLDYMQAMDMLVLASLNEAVGLVLIEAQSQGIPVIATKVGGVPEIVEDGKSGILVQPGSPAELIAAMEKLINNSSQRLEMGRYAKKSVSEKYSVDVFINNISQTYEALIQAKD
ncbi:MAG: glycosyltransferase family 4 protein [Candidatus Omnitrophica bacterium]|nr:glycosyltransferase family 4 protein [Candidatus Omnitrophota bacterium]